MHLKDGSSLEGVLLKKRFGGYLRLELASVLQDSESTVELEGTIRVPRENVSFIQDFSG
jgi:hypothetical protein